jgi:hypothetical protein
MNNQGIIDELIHYATTAFIDNHSHELISLNDSNYTYFTLQSLYSKFLAQLLKDEKNFHPDISTPHSFVLMIPPHLSAKEYQDIFGNPFDSTTNNTDITSKIIKTIPLIAEEVQLPTRTTKVSEIKLITGSIPVAEEITTDNQLSVTYIADKDQLIYTFHKIWIEYISEVTKGLIKPADEYIQNGLIDYVAAFFIIRFDQLARLRKLIYIPYAIPLGINTNESVSYRQNDLIKITVNYQILTYEEFDYFELEHRGVTLDNPQNHPFVTKLIEALKFWDKELKYRVYKKDEVEHAKKKKLTQQELKQSTINISAASNNNKSIPSIMNKILSSTTNSNNNIAPQNASNTTAQQLTNEIEEKTTNTAKNNNNNSEPKTAREICNEQKDRALLLHYASYDTVKQLVEENKEQKVILKGKNGSVTVTYKPGMIPKYLVRSKSIYDKFKHVNKELSEDALKTNAIRNSDCKEAYQEYLNAEKTLSG